MELRLETDYMQKGHRKTR